MEKIEFLLGVSSLFLRFLVIVYLAAGGVILLLPIPMILKILGIALSVWRFLALANRHVYRSAKHSVVRIWQNSTGRWGCQTKGGSLAIGDLKGDSFKSRLFVILRLRFPARSQSVLIPRDSLPFSEYQHLCIRLKSCNPSHLQRWK